MAKLKQLKIDPREERLEDLKDQLFTQLSQVEASLEAVGEDGKFFQNFSKLAASLRTGEALELIALKSTLEAAENRAAYLQKLCAKGVNLVTETIPIQHEYNSLKDSI